MKERYETPETEVIVLKSEDVMIVSGPEVPIGGMEG